MTSFAEAIAQIKGNLEQILPDDLVDHIAQLHGLATRECTLTPAVTVRLAVRRCLESGTAVSHLRHLSGLDFHRCSYGRAVQRLPETVFSLLAGVVARKLRRDRPPPLWHGHRVRLIDGSGVSMPDTPALQAAFGQPGNQKPGCGFPVAHLLALFDHETGYLVETHLAPLRTHDVAHAPTMHDAMQKGDLLLGDRAFGSFAHLALLQKRGLHGLFRLHQRRPHGLGRDRRVTYPKPPDKPSWMTGPEYAELPKAITVREVRVTVKIPGCRVRKVWLVTTLLDREKYPARDLAKLYAQRWAAETNLRHLKTTLNMDVLRSRTVDGVRKEVQAFVLAYNLVRSVMATAGVQQGVPAERISFVDALRWLRRAKADEPVPVLLVHPVRPGRYEPRAVKRRPKEFDRLTCPRSELKANLLKTQGK